jgi:Peptidase family M28
MTTRGRSLTYWVILIAAVALAAWGMMPPPPREGTAEDEFTLSRALVDLRAITRAPHPAGSAENARVREILAARLKAMGLGVEVQRGTGVRQSPRAPEFVAIAPVANIIAVLPGRDRSQPAVAVMAHYDSVPFSFGASDDGAGTVAVLETARALIAGPQPERDVIFLLTDGEEMGLLGAQMFFDDHPLAKRIGVVVNAEARGSKGRAVMFETSPGNAELVDLWAAHAISPSGNSISAAVYRLLPNDTDLSVPLIKGIPGINAAYAAGHFDYHSTTDSFATIDRATLQHLGDFTLTTTRALALAKALPAAAGDATYFDVLGLLVVRYPPWLGWVPLLFAGAALVLLYRRERSLGLLKAAGGVVAILGATAALLGVGHALGVYQIGTGAARYREVMAEIDVMIWGMAALVLAALLLLRAGPAMRLGAISLLLALGIVAQIMLPGAAFLFAWPALIGAGLMLAERQGGARRPVVTVLMAVVAMLMLAVVLQLLASAYIMVGLLSAGVMGLALPMLVALLPASPSSSRRVGVGALVLSLGVVGWTVVTDGFSKRHPRPGDLFVLHDSKSGKAWWATTSDASYLPGGKVEEFSFPPFGRRPMQVVAATGVAPQTAAGRLTIAERAEAEQRVWDIEILRPPRLATIAIRPDGALTDVRLNGRPISLAPREWTRISYRAPQSMAMQLTASGAGDVAIRYQIALPGLPADEPHGADPKTNWTLLSGTETVFGEWSPAAR